MSEGARVERFMSQKFRRASRLQAQESDIDVVRAVVDGFRQVCKLFPLPRLSIFGRHSAHCLFPAHTELHFVLAILAAWDGEIGLIAMTEVLVENSFQLKPLPVK